MAAMEEATGPEDMIVCRDVHKWYGDFHALRGISTTVKRREVVVAFGPLRFGQVHVYQDHQPA